MCGLVGLHNSHKLWAEVFVGHNPPFKFDNWDATSHFGYWHIEMLREAYPDSRFIYFERDVDEWMDSWLRLDTMKHDRIRKFQPTGKYINRLLAVQTMRFNRTHFRATFLRHREYVEKHDDVTIVSEWDWRIWQEATGVVYRGQDKFPWVKD